MPMPTIQTWSQHPIHHYERVGCPVYDYRWRTLGDLPILGHSV